MSLKRKLECARFDDEYEVKKTKFNELLFTNDYIQHVFSFLDQDFIFRTCLLISKQFREQSINTPVALCIRRNEHLERIRNLTHPLNITELKIDKNVHYDVLEWIFHHPPKHLKKLSIDKSDYTADGKPVGDDYVEKLCGIPALSTLISLHIGEPEITNQGCSFIANCEHFQNLTELSVDTSLISDFAYCYDKGVEEIVTSKYMSNLTILCFEHFYKLRKIDGILSSPLFLNVKILELSYCWLEKLDFPQVMPLLEDLNVMGYVFKSSDLVALTQTRNLTRLNLSQSELDDEGCKILSENQYLSKVTDLDLENTEFTAKGLNYILSSPYFKQLKCLNLMSFVDNEGFKILAESENMKNLTKLELGYETYGNEISWYGLSYIFNSDNLPNLKSLNFQCLNLRDNNFASMLVKSSIRKNLTSLEMYECELDLSIIQHVAQLDGLRELFIATEHIAVDMPCAAECIASSSHMSNLTSLTLRCNITDSDCLHMANSIYLKQLTTLDLSSKRIGNVGCEYFANSPNFPNLTTLVLPRRNNVGLEMIQNSPYFRNLKRFNIY